MRERFSGLLFLIMGLGVAYVSVVMPLVAARNNAASVHIISLNVFVVTPPIIIGGAMFLIFGPDTIKILQGVAKKKALTVILFVICLSLGFLLYFWLKSELRSLGYGT